MSEQLPKDPVSLEDLKQAIEHAESWLAHKNGSPDSINFARRYESARGDAWRTAFEWHIGLLQRHDALSDELAHLADWIAIDREEEKGMALIREKLQS